MHVSTRLWITIPLAFSILAGATAVFCASSPLRLVRSAELPHQPFVALVNRINPPPCPSGWGLLFLLWLVANAKLAQEAEGALLDGTVPEDATGEVARVLGCRDYFSVLEVEPAADKDAVKKAYKSKVLMVHPDKCGGLHAAAAFRRVNDANTLLADDARRANYIQQLLDYAAQRDLVRMRARRCLFFVGRFL